MAEVASTTNTTGDRKGEPSHRQIDMNEQVIYK